jgi:TRAP-type C4-dicarboxylate transport system permease small subunit
MQDPLIDRVRTALRTLADETAEGVISTAIAVLILAFVGAGMWVGFNAMMGSSCDAAAEQLDSSIGTGGGTTIDCQ